MSEVNELCADEIERTISNRIKEAEQLKLTQFAEELYSVMKGWAYQIDKHGMDWVGSEYILSVKQDDGTIEVIGRDNNSFIVREYDKKNGKNDWDYNYDRDTDITISNLSIIYNGKVVFTTTMIHTTTSADFGFYSSTRTDGVLCYIPGAWLDELKTLCLNIKTVEYESAEARKKANRENPERINELKSKWGL